MAAWDKGSERAHKRGSGAAAQGRARRVSEVVAAYGLDGSGAYPASTARRVAAARPALARRRRPSAPGVGLVPPRPPRRAALASRFYAGVLVGGRAAFVGVKRVETSPERRLVAGQRRRPAVVAPLAFAVVVVSAARCLRRRAAFVERVAALEIRAATVATASCL